MNIAEIYESHYLPEKSKKRRPSTVAGYDSSVRLHVLPRWGSCEIEDCLLYTSYINKLDL